MSVRENSKLGKSSVGAALLEIMEDYGWATSIGIGIDGSGWAVIAKNNLDYGLGDLLNRDIL